MQKNFIHLRSFEDKPNYPNSKPKFCVTCGIKATQEALFNVGDGVILVEKYCDICAKNVKWAKKGSNAPKSKSSDAHGDKSGITN